NASRRAFPTRRASDLSRRQKGLTWLGQARGAEAMDADHHGGGGGMTLLTRDEIAAIIHAEIVDTGYARSHTHHAIEACPVRGVRSEEHTSELQSRGHL